MRDRDAKPPETVQRKLSALGVRSRGSCPGAPVPGRLWVLPEPRATALPGAGHAQRFKWTEGVLFATVTRDVQVSVHVLFSHHVRSQCQECPRKHDRAQTLKSWRPSLSGVPTSEPSRARTGPPGVAGERRQPQHRGRRWVLVTRVHGRPRPGTHGSFSLLLCPGCRRLTLALTSFYFRNTRAKKSLRRGC